MSKLKDYKKPEIDIIKFDTKVDVITQSCTDDTCPYVCTIVCALDIPCETDSCKAWPGCQGFNI